jgi:hypothetical protein
MAFQMNASSTLQEGNWYTSHIYLITAFGCLIFQSLGMKKVIMVVKLSKEPKFPQNLCPISLLFTTGNLFKKVSLNIVQ